MQRGLKVVCLAAFEIIPIGPLRSISLRVMCTVIRSVVAFNCPNDHRSENCIIDELSSRLCPIILTRDIAQRSSALVGTATMASSWTSINVVQSARRISIKFHAGVPARSETKLSLNSVYVRLRELQCFACHTSPARYHCFENQFF